MFRVVAYLLIVCVLILLAVLSSILSGLAAGTSVAETTTAIVVLVILIIILLLLILFLLCLAKAKDRVRKERGLYKEAHGSNEKLRGEAAALLERLQLERLDFGRCARICDILVRKKLPKDCIRLPFEVTRYPDPCIYSQFFLMANNQPVTWDNPNVWIFLGGVEQDTYNLAVSTTYEVQVGIENASPFFDAVGTSVQVNMLTFGIGQPSPTPIHSFTVDVPAATSFPGVIETFSWTTPSVADHYCLQVLIDHANDINPSNNEGWNNTNVRDVAPGEQMSLAIPIRNPIQMERNKKIDDRMLREFAAVTVTIDSYELDTANIEAATLDDLFTRRETLWGADVTPGELTIAPGEKGDDLKFRVTVPNDAAVGTTAVFNVNARAGDRPIGGVTIRLNVI